MSDLTNSRIVAAYRERTPGSAAAASEAAEMFPSGITHDSRHLKPYGIFVQRAQGSRKWDVDGNEYVDYYGGHGALLLGHNHPAVGRAVQEALGEGTQFGASHPREIRWARIVKELVPSAERVRFTSSGTEATLMALRLARACTGKSKVVRLMTHFHGWHDHMAFGQTTHFDGTPTPGVLADVARNVLLVPPGDLDAVRGVFETDEDVAAIILEPTGASFGMVPLPDGYLAGLRELTSKHGVVLIFDEVVTGFRVSPGGAQAHYGVTPDMSTLAKILAGGLPGGAVVGRKDILDALDFDVAKQLGREKIQHQGTFNANPVSAAAGTATLEIVGSTDACAKANAYGERLREGLNEIFAEKKVSWAAYGSFSGFQIFTNPERRSDIRPGSFDPLSLPFQELKGFNPDTAGKLKLALLLNGVDIAGRPGGTISAMHTESDMAHTLQAFRDALDLLREGGEI